MAVVIASIIICFIITHIKNLNKTKQCILIAIVLSLIPLFHNISYSTDLTRYVIKYNQLHWQSISDLFTKGSKDPFFYAIAKVTSSLGIHSEGWMYLISACFCICLAIFMYNYSANIMMSVLALFALYFGFTITGLRQTIALAAVLISYKYIMEQNLLKFAISVAIASLFHSTAILFAPAYFVANVKFGKKQYLWIALTVLPVMLFSGQIRQLIYRFAWSEALRGYASSEIGLTWSGYIIHLSMLLFSMLMLKNDDKDNLTVQIMQKFFNCMIVGLVGYSFSTIIAESFRIAMYYSIGEIVVLPSVIGSIKNRNNRFIIGAAISLLLLIYIFIGNRYQLLLKY